jgi:hypothetical protein
MWPRHRPSLRKAIGATGSAARASRTWAPAGVAWEEIDLREIYAFRPGPWLLCRALFTARATGAVSDRGRLTLAITCLQKAGGSGFHSVEETTGGVSDAWSGCRVIFALSGNLSGWRRESTDKSTSRSGQYRCAGAGLKTLRICRIVADLNQGNSEYGMASSSSSTRIQTQCPETLVTPAYKVAVPGINDLLLARFS